MKKTLLLITLLFSGFVTLLAGVVPQDKARRAAESFFASQPGTKAGQASLSLVWRLPSAENGEDNLLYAFENQAGGYVIVSGDDAAGPVLGYSPSGRFPGPDRMPDGMKWLLDYYGFAVSMAREKGWAASSVSSIFDPSKVVKLRTALWGQLSPYNNECPKVSTSDSHPPVGCVATAIGIIMNYHRWPDRGQGVLPSYSYTYGGVTEHIEGVTLGHRYDWDAMNAESPDYGEIARLLHEMGVMTEMRYQGSGSGTSSNYVTRLSQYFGYDKGITINDRDNYTDARFEGMIRAEIDAKRPLLFSAYNTTGGHTMVIDGYCGRYFSINFGYEGRTVARDGYSDPRGEGTWFLLTPVEGHEKDFAAYHYDQFINCNIKPDEGGGEPVMRLSNSRFSLPYDFAVGKPFTQSISILSSLPADAYVVHTDAAGNIKETISGVVHLEGNSDRIFGWNSSVATCTVNKTVEAGDRIVVAMYSGGKRVDVESNRPATFIFGDISPKDGLLVGYVTGNETNPVNGFLEQALRDGKSWNVREYWNDFFYFRCYKDLVWRMVDLNDPGFEWDSGELYDRDTEYGEKPRFVSAFHEDWYYNFIRLKKGNYRLMIRNPLTGEELSINVNI
ncbi:MAG: C10 family peptidase [Bacteroidales bacterium]|nr:C10 family peptidase [Bacteroidales bacterium]